MKHDFYNHLNKEISFLIVDFNRPNESRLLVESLHKHVKFENYEVIFYSNGGIQDYVIDFYKKGLITRLILNQKNDGIGMAQPRLIEFCQTDYFINVQCDRYMSRDFSLEELNSMKHTFDDNKKLGAIDFCFNNIFSENAYMMNTNFACKVPNHKGGGPGPFYFLGEGSETSTYNWIIKNKLEVKKWPYKLFDDSGMYAVQELPCGGIFKKRTDTQQLTIIKKPLKKYNEVPGLRISDKEWEQILNGTYINGTIPDGHKKDVFFYFSDKLDPLQ